MPTVSWFINERMVEGHLEPIGNNVIVNRLEVPGVKREHLNSSYKCQASNTKLMMPVEKSVRLELLCKYTFKGTLAVQNYFDLRVYRFTANKTHLHIHHFCPLFTEYLISLVSGQSRVFQISDRYLFQ